MHLGIDIIVRFPWPLLIDLQDDREIAYSNSAIFFLNAYKCELTLDRIVGSFTLRHVMNAERYLAMVQDEIWPVYQCSGDGEDFHA